MIVVFLLAFSLALNINQYFNKKKPKKSLSTDANQLLHDLTRGGSIVKITVIDPAGLMIYKARE